MTKRGTRIRWNQEERSTLLAAYQELRAQDPQRGVVELFAAAQIPACPQAPRLAADRRHGRHPTKSLTEHLRA